MKKMKQTTEHMTTANQQQTKHLPTLQYKTEDKNKNQEPFYHINEEEENKKERSKMEELNKSPEERKELKIDLLSNLDNMHNEKCSSVELKRMEG